MKKGLTLLLLCLGSLSPTLHAHNPNQHPEQNLPQSPDPQADKLPAKSVKTGAKPGFLPSVAFNSDLGFQYGALAEINFYGDGSDFPQYRHLLYAEAAYTTKRSGLFRVFYDSKYLLPNKVRLTVDLTYIPEKLSDFYGFNGAKSIYNAPWTDKEDAAYVSRAFYKMDKNFFRATADFQGPLARNLYWAAGAGWFHYTAAPVDLPFLNKGKKEDKALPEVPGLYDLYKDWGLLRSHEAEGGSHPFVRAGLTFDSRNRPNNPSRGLWADAFFTYYAAFGQQKDYSHLNFNASLRHYLPIWGERGILAYRLGYQSELAGETPFYMKNHFSTLFTKRANYELLGGANSLRGVIRNRIAADGYVYANIEFRLRLFDFHIGKQDFYVGINPLFDAGRVTREHELPVDKATLQSRVTASGYKYADFFSEEPGRWHAGAGAGLKIAMNENFILSVDYAKALAKQDGNSGLYIQIGYMF